MEKIELSPKVRNLMVSEVLDQGQNISDVAKRFGISRVTLYKWIKRAKEEIERKGEAELVNKERVVEKYWRQTPDKYEQAILSLVSKHPEWGIRSLVKNLPRIGDLPIVGHHGIQNVLRRHHLSTYEQRLAYTKGLQTPVVTIVDDVVDKVSDFFRLPKQSRTTILRLLTIFGLSAVTTIIVSGIVSYSVGPISIASWSERVGLGFALVALTSGMFFFLYSLKYYLTLAVVLSFSQKENTGKKSEDKGSTFLDVVLGRQTISAESTIGLTSDLSSINLKDKPFISVQIPFFNEKNVVERSIHAAISFDYPSYEVILCDDSTDQTTEIIQKRMERYLLEGEKLKTIEGDGWILAEVEVKPGVVLKHLHRTSRQGFKGAALALALKLSNPKTEKVAIFDADFVPYPDSLTSFLKYFQTAQQDKTPEEFDKVAAVQGYQWHVLNKSENWITRGVRSEYSGSYVIERSGAEIYGGLKQISGSVYMIRKDVLEQIGWGSSITEDFELTLKLYNAGYKVLYTPYIQAPAECASTIKRLIRQRMRWAEGHSFNIKKYILPLLSSGKLSTMEKVELAYLTPYYLQAFFFVIGTLSWLISESVFRVTLPFWTELWGWSLVLTNMISLPLLNSVGLFLEESEERDYMGLGSFVALSYILVPFQAYAAVKGFVEKEEGTWFRTPKSGKITDVFTRGKFYRFIQGILPGRSTSVSEATPDYTNSNLRPNISISKDKPEGLGLRSTFKKRLVTTLSLISVFGLVTYLNLADRGLYFPLMDVLKVSAMIVLSIAVVAYIYNIKVSKVKKLGYIVARFSIVSVLIISWILSSWPQVPFTNFPPKVGEAWAAEVAIDAGASSSTSRGMRSTVFTSTTVGYHFFIESDSDFMYTKTTDGGATWAAPVDIFAGTVGAYDVWFDQWTPGGTGTVIHTWWIESNPDDVHYRSLDTNGDSLGTDIQVFNGGTASFGRGVFVSGAKAVGGNMLVAFDIDAGAETGTYRSTDGGATWGARTNMVEATIDQLLMFPGNATDTQDMWAVYQDASQDQLTLKVHDDSANTNSESSAFITLLENVTDATGQYGFSASVRPSDGHLLVAAVSEYDVSTADFRTFDINGTASITEKTAITSNIDDIYYPSVYIQSDGTVRVAYIGKRDGSETLGTTAGVYYTTSTDGMATWSSGDTAYSSATGDWRQTWAPLNGDRFLVAFMDISASSIHTNTDNAISVPEKIFFMLLVAPFIPAIIKKLRKMNNTQ